MINFIYTLFHINNYTFFRHQPIAVSAFPTIMVNVVLNKGNQTLKRFVVGVVSCGQHELFPLPITRLYYPLMRVYKLER